MGLCNGPVQATGCSVTDELEQKHHTVTRVLGNRQVHSFPRLGGNLDDWIAYSKMRQKKKKENGYILTTVKGSLVVPKTKTSRYLLQNLKLTITIRAGTDV